jgi:alkylhydroperoxidase family enzyme
MRTLLALFLLPLAGAAADPPRLPELSTADAWKALPRDNPPLPVWARTLAASIPKGTAKLLELDDLHRARSPIGNALRAKLRYVASDAVGSPYGKAYAANDAKYAGVSAEELEAWAKFDGEPTTPEQKLAALARKMALAADTVTDAEFADLLEHFGPEKMVGVVHTLAYAGFQDRVLLALGCQVEKDGPLPPLNRTFDPKWYENVTTPKREPTAKKELPKKSEYVFEWTDLTGKHLPTQLDLQKQRSPRVPIPSDEKLAWMPAEDRARTKRIVWSTIGQGYQPKLTTAWFDSMTTASAEGKVDPVFKNTVFWIVTRTNRCFY